MESPWANFLKLKPTSDKLSYVSGKGICDENFWGISLCFQWSSYVEIPLKKLSVEYNFSSITNLNVCIGLSLGSTVVA